MKQTHKGIRIAKGQSTIDEMKKRVPHWIHDTREDEHSVSGIIYLRSCKCSECGYHANMEKPVCPQCGSKMNSIIGVDSE